MSAFANDPQEAANSLVTLLDQAQNAVPKELRPKTPVRVGVRSISYNAFLSPFCCTLSFWFISFVLHLSSDRNWILVSIPISGNCRLKGLGWRCVRSNLASGKFLVLIYRILLYFRTLKLLIYVE